MSLFEDVINSFNSIVLWYKCNDLDSVAIDYSGNSYNGTWVNNPLYDQNGSIISDQNNKSIFLDSTESHHMKRDMPSEMKVQTITFIVAFKKNNADSSVLMSGQPAGTWANGRGFTISASTTLNIRCGDGSGSYTNVNGSTDISDDSWHLVVGVYDGNTISLYLDGELENSYVWGSSIMWSDAGGIGPSPGQFYIGAERNNSAGTDGNANFLTGYVDQCIVLNESLQLEDVVSLYNAWVFNKSLIIGKCVRGIANLPAHREIYAYSMSDGKFRGFAETDSYGNFSVPVFGVDSVFLRIVDPDGIYSTEIRENIIPIADP